MRTTFKHLLAAALIAALAGCTAHPRGESDERAAAMDAGKPYVQPIEKREVAPLAADATPDQMVAYALLTNAGVEQRYWEWRSVLEQVPQDGTQKTNVMISFTSMITNGITTPEMNSLGIGNDPASSIVLPNKLQTAARAALEEARAAGKRFDQARFELRSQVLAAYANYALAAELTRLEQADTDLLAFTAKVIESRVGTGGAMQQDLLKANNELELANDDLAVQKAKLPALRAGLNALLNREARAALDVPKGFAAVRAFGDDAELLAAAAKRNPELEAMAREIAAKQVGIRMAKLEYMPEFGINFTSDLSGITQTVLGSISLPLVRYEAINAGVRQAQANLRAAQAARAQAGHDLAARVVEDLAMIRDLDRQIALYEGTILPRAARIVTTTQNTYASGQNSLLDLLDAQRSLIALRRMVAEFRAEQARQAADLEAATAMNLAAPGQ